MVDEFGSELAVIGKRNQDYVADDIVRGEHIFAEDINRPGKLYARILGSKYAKAKITGINTSKAEALEGVKAVITYKEVSTWSDQMLCVDQEIAAVAAVDEDTAERALDLIEVTYDVQVPVIDPDEAMKPSAPNTGVFANTNVTPTPSNVTYGDVAKGFTEADVVMEEEFGYVARHTHNQIEPFVATVWWEGNDCFIWITTQNPFGHKAALQAGLAASLKVPVPLNRVHIYNHGTGGGFGNKGGSPINLPCALLARKAGKPVTLKLTRKLYTVIGGHQYGAKMKMKIGAKNDGTLTAVESTFWSDGGKNGGRSTFCDVPQSTWKCANFKADHWGIATNKGNSGAWRCVQHPGGGVLSDLMLEKMAARLKINPLEFRRKIFLNEPIFQQTGRPLFSWGVRLCLDKAAELIGYSAKYHDAGARTLPDGRLHGIGIHARCDGHGSMSGARGIIINMCEDGTVLFNIGGARNMGGPGAIGAIIAETIGVTFDQCRCGDWGNTDVCAEGGSQGGSTYTISNGAAAMVAAQDVRQQLFAVAAGSATGMLKTTPDVLDAKEGKIFLKADPTKFVTH
ncbi:MAG: xanthine dehydrogenase family protein, partial [Dehalococcoidales bacterium]|nr:xanthine dehydrogenase family protein [Dehalococcoidales bacterium]